MSNRLAFGRQVGEALRHLYDYERLSRSPLNEWLSARPGYSGQDTLRQIILAAIEALKPEPGTAPGTPAWRTYQILFYRFVQCMSVGEVASQLGFGERHLRRHQARAIGVLADLLWERQAGAPAADELAQQADLSANLAWLQSEPALQVADLSEAMARAEEIVARLLQAQHTALVVDLPAGLPHVRVHPLAMRQVLVSALSYAASLNPSGALEVSARATGEEVLLHVACRPAEPSADQGRRQESEALAVSRRLLEMCGGRLELAPGAGSTLSITIRVPVLRRRPVLIVDDNADTARLFARYLAESRYQAAIARSGREAAVLVEEILPAAIVLDVMMPDQDGWEVLALLKAHPVAGDIPVIVATILAERELAFSLGAAAFLHKPVSQAELLAALDRQVG